MPKAQKTGKRRAIGVQKRARYAQESRRQRNKQRKLKNQIKRFEKILARNPDAKVGRNIEDLKKRLKEV